MLSFEKLAMLTFQNLFNLTQFYFQSESEVHPTKSNTLITIIFGLFLCFQRGDVVKCEIDEIGCMSNKVQLKGY